MNGYSLTEKMRRTRQWVRLTGTEQALFYELVAVCNEKKWQDVFLCSNIGLCHALNISPRHLRRIRETLVNAGLIYYKSGKSIHNISMYSFTMPFSETTGADETITEADETLVTGADETLVTEADETLVTGADEHHYINLSSFKTPSIPHDRESIKSQLLADQTWKEITAMHSGLSIRFLEILPAQIDIFMQYIVATGEEHTILTLSDAKRRFFWWWKNQGKKAYENNTEDPGTIIW